MSYEPKCGHSSKSRIDADSYASDTAVASTSAGSVYIKGVSKRANFQHYLSSTQTSIMFTHTTSETSFSTETETSYSYTSIQTSSVEGQQAGSLSITVNHAQELKSVELMGAQDPYVQFSLENPAEKHFSKTLTKTFTQKGAGKNPQWNQSFEIPLVGQPNLYVEVMDEESGVDEIIGFAAIPVNQIVHAPGGGVNGLFKLFTVKGEEAGILNMVLIARGFNSPPGEISSEPVPCQTFVDEAHLKRMKSQRIKGVAGDVGTAILGGALAVGAGFLAHKVYKDHEKKEQEEEAERENFEREKEELERQKAELEEQRRQQEESENREEQERENRGEEDDGCCERRRRCEDDSDASDWDPVGTYAAGDRVSYHGRTYVCLQGHTSNPTWTPDAAHSLWRTE